MILDSGICGVYKLTNTAAAGDMPTETPVLVSRHWFGELGFESSPRQRTESQQVVETSRRIRILENRAIVEKTVVVIDTETYQVERVYHGKDQESGEAITDLSLTKGVSVYGAE